MAAVIFRKMPNGQTIAIFKRVGGLPRKAQMTAEEAMRPKFYSRKERRPVPRGVDRNAP